MTKTYMDSYREVSLDELIKVNGGSSSFTQKKSFDGGGISTYRLPDLEPDPNEPHVYPEPPYDNGKQPEEPVPPEDTSPAPSEPVEEPKPQPTPTPSPVGSSEPEPTVPEVPIPEDDTGTGTNNGSSGADGSSGGSGSGSSNGGSGRDRRQNWGDQPEPGVAPETPPSNNGGSNGGDETPEAASDDGTGEAPTGQNGGQENLPSGTPNVQSGDQTQTTQQNWDAVRKHLENFHGIYPPGFDGNTTGVSQSKDLHVVIERSPLDNGDIGKIADGYFKSTMNVYSGDELIFSCPIQSTADHPDLNKSGGPNGTTLPEGKYTCYPLTNSGSYYKPIHIINEELGFGYDQWYLFHPNAFTYGKRMEESSGEWYRGYSAGCQVPRLDDYNRFVNILEDHGYEFTGTFTKQSTYTNSFTLEIRNAY